MRVPVSLQFTAGLALLIVLVAVSGGGAKHIGKNDVASPETNTIQKPSLLSLFRQFSAKTLASLTASATAVPTARQLNGKSKSVGKKSVENVKPQVSSKTPVKPSKTRETSHKSIKSRQNNRVSGQFSEIADAVRPPRPSEMQVLTYSQKRDRLRQELVKETEDNCLAKILCGGPAKPKPKPTNGDEEPNTAQETAYLIKEFFNIFDFTEDAKKPSTKGPTSATPAEKDEEEKDLDEEDEEDELDDEEDEIYRTNPTTKAASKKYSTNKPKVTEHKLRTTEPVLVKISNQKAAPTTTTTTTTSTTSTTTTTPRPETEEDDSRDNMVTPSMEVVTTTMISTSMKGSATLQPVDDNAWAIPLHTANGKDYGGGGNYDDDDEEEDNNRYDDEEEGGSTIHRVTLEELVGDIKLTPEDMAMLRSGRGGRSMKIPLKTVAPSKYVQAKLRQMKKMDSEAKKLQIAGRIARSFREPRQCRQFSSVAQEVLQTCPLTTEVIRFFNSNLKNSTQIEIKKIPSRGNSTGGGLVILNDDVNGMQQSYFVDNSPQTVNTRVTNDLKNPSVPSSTDEEQAQHTVYEKRPNPNPQHSNLNQHNEDVTKLKPQAPTEQTNEKEPSSTGEDSDEEPQSDEEGDDDDDDGDEEDEEEEEDDGEEEEEEEDDASKAEDESNGNEEIRRTSAESVEVEENADENAEEDADAEEPVEEEKNVPEEIQGNDTNQPNVKIKIRPKKPQAPPPRGPQLPPGIIRVYGIPQASFDADFSQTADKLGNSKPVHIFGEEDIDGPNYKRRRQMQFGNRLSKNRKDEDDNSEAENVPFSSRIPKHPPLSTEPFVNDGDDDDDNLGKQPFQNPNKNQNNKGKPLGGVKGVKDEDDDDDDDNSSTSSKKKVPEKKKHKTQDKTNDKDQSTEESMNPPFVPSMMYNPQYQYYSHQNYYQNGGGHISPVPRPRYRPIVRPIQIVPDTNVPIGGLSFRPSPGREYMRPGRLYPMYHPGK